MLSFTLFVVVSECVCVCVYIFSEENRLHQRPHFITVTLRIICGMLKWVNALVIIIFFMTVYLYFNLRSGLKTSVGGCWTGYQRFMTKQKNLVLICLSTVWFFFCCSRIFGIVFYLVFIIIFRTNASIFIFILTRTWVFKNLILLWMCYFSFFLVFIIFFHISFQHFCLLVNWIELFAQ